MGTFSPNFVFPNIFLSAPMRAGNCFSSMQSTLFSTTINLLMNNSAITIHSDVWVWIPLFISITKNIRSIIWAPPIIVLIREAWPGQSTSVNCKKFCFTFVYNYAGTLVMKEEKPKSRVIPLSFDCGLLSRLAVDATWVRTRQIDVFPESTCPNTPTLIFKQSDGFIVASYSASISSNYFSIHYLIINIFLLFLKMISKIKLIVLLK